MSLHKLQYSKIVSRILASERVDRKFGRLVFTKHFCISRRAVDSESLDLFLISPENYSEVTQEATLHATAMLKIQD